MNEHKAKRWLLMLALIGLLTWPAVVSAQNWTREIELKDRQANGAQPTGGHVAANLPGRQKGRQSCRDAQTLHYRTEL